MYGFCQTQPCIYKVYGRCTGCGMGLCFQHMGYQPPAQPTIRDYSFINWWSETAEMTSDYAHVRDQIEAYWYRLHGLCTSCRVAAIKHQFPNAPAEAAQIKQRAQDLDRRRMDYVRANWRQILDRHRRGRRRDDQHRLGFMRWIDVWHVGGRHVDSSSRFTTSHIDYTVITADNRVLKEGKLVPFDPGEVKYSDHWLYRLAYHYGMLPKE